MSGILKPENNSIRIWLYNLINELDGNGLTVTDWNDLKLAINLHEGLNFESLRELFSIKEK